MTVTIVSGTPGSGKTNLCSYLAERDSRGVHIESDHFFRFLSHGLDPSTTESKTQNEIIVRSYAAATKVYSDGGYSVYLDGVIGPWLFPLLMPILGKFEYVLLHASLHITLARIKNRSGQDSATPGVAMRMHKQFSNVVNKYSRHVIDTGTLSIDAVAMEIEARRVNGGLVNSVPAVH